MASKGAERTGVDAVTGAGTIVRSYRGRQQADALRAFQRDATDLAEQGYVPTSQSWAPGQWGCGAFLVAVLLFVVLVGIFVFIYMLIVKPEGTLTVTYAMRGPLGSPNLSSRAISDAPTAEARDEAVSKAYDLALAFQERSQATEWRLIEQFQNVVRELSPQLGDLLILDDEKERVWLRATGNFEADVIPDDAKGGTGETQWTHLRSANAMVEFYDPTDLFGDLAERIASLYPNAVPAHEGMALNGVPAEASGDRLPDRLRQLNEALEAGLITDAEHAEKRRDLLSGL